MERKNASLGGSGEKAALKRDYFIHEEVSARRRKGILVRVLLVLVKTPPVASFLSPSLSPYPRDLLPSIILPQPFYFFPPLSLPPPLLLSLSLSLSMSKPTVYQSTDLHNNSGLYARMQPASEVKTGRRGKKRPLTAFAVCEGSSFPSLLIRSLSHAELFCFFFSLSGKKKLPFPLSRLPCLFAFARRPNKA